MSAELLERLDGRVTFVVGKGGVGKTTMAGALALALADRGTATHLLSVDPAHSLGDLFGAAVGSAPGASPCVGRLILEELDADRLVADRLGSLKPGLRELIDQGTYLDVEDAESLLDASLPGLDEVGAALRIGQLQEPRLVVDTAPTGHLLRLLHIPDVVRGWLEAFDAMAAKADAVATALVGQHVTLVAERELASLEQEVAAFEAAVASADFVVVTAPGAVVAAETRRLLETLRARGLRVAATVAVQRGRDVTADIHVPYRRALSGCADLRSWWAGEAGPDDPSAAAGAGPRGARSGARAGVAAAPADALDRELVVFAGKGGVGKTTCAVATALRLAESGPVLLMGADPAGSLHDVLDGAEVPGLQVRELDGDRELEQLRAVYRDEVERAFASLGLDRSARLDRAVVESLWELAPPGLDELMGVSRLAEEVEAGTRIVLDPAPTGHFLRLVAMPELALDWIRRLMNLLLKYGAVADLDGLGNELLRLARRFRTLRERLMDGDRTAIVVVTLDEPLVRAETERLAARLRSLHLPLVGLLVNRSTGAVESPRAVPTWRAPEVEEPRGVPALREFTRAWERVT